MRGLQTPDWSTVLFSPPAFSQDQLRAKYADKADITVSGEGVNGTRAVDLVNGTDGKHLPWVQTAANSTAKIVLFNYAINDASAVNAEPIDQYRAALTLLVTEAKKDGKVPVLEEPNPICTAGSAALESYVAVMREVAATQGVTLIPQYDIIKAIPGWQSMYAADCIHPLLDIYKGKAQRQADGLSDIVGRMLNQG